MNKLANSDVLAVVIHAFYIDVFTEILRYLKILDVPIKLYVTSPYEHEAELRKLLMSSGLGFYLLPVSNRGRDVLPFLMIMPSVIEGGHVVVLKLHTKKTQHRSDGDVWMGEILSELVEKNKVGRYFDLIKCGVNIGMIAPAGHVVQMSTHFGSNKRNVVRISNRLGFSKSDVMKQVFVAGTMFYAHVSALKPMIGLGLSEEDFEIENNQIDGTMAHAVERCFSISCLSANLRLISSDGIDSEISQVVKDGYAYADATNYSDNASVVEILAFYMSKFKKLVVKIIQMMLN